MLSRKFELAKRQHPKLENLLEKLWAYLQAQSSDSQPFFLPKLAGAALGINDGEAYVLLEVLANAGALRRVFNVYCKTSGILLATVHSEKELNEIPYCDECDCLHDTSELSLEIAFEPAEEGGSLRRAA